MTRTVWHEEAKLCYVHAASERAAFASRARQTVERNADVLKAKPEVVAYSWGVGAPPIVADIIVCGDCLYNKDHAHLLVRGLLDCASQSTSVYLCGAVGEDAGADWKQVLLLFEEAQAALPEWKRIVTALEELPPLGAYEQIHAVFLVPPSLPCPPR